MPTSLIVTEAIVLHAFDYLESSRILRLATREVGVQSVIARGARRSRRRFGAALDLFAQGTAQFTAQPGRDLQTLASFDVTRARPGLAAEFARFTGAAAIAELALGFGRDEPHPEVFDAVAAALDDIAAAGAGDAEERALAGAWSLVTAFGFTPSLDACASCHADVPEDVAAMFSPPAGGVVCRRCARLAVTGRTLPPSARAVLRDWHNGAPARLAGSQEVRAHQRLLREFVQAHIMEGRTLRAFDAWVRQRWSA